MHTASNHAQKRSSDEVTILNPISNHAQKRAGLECLGTGCLKKRRELSYSDSYFTSLIDSFGDTNRPFKHATSKENKFQMILAKMKKAAHFIFEWSFLSESAPPLMCEGYYHSFWSKWCDFLCLFSQ